MGFFMSKERKKLANAEAAIFLKEISSAKVEAQMLRNYLVRAKKLVDKSKEKEHLYEVAGDLILEIPEAIERLEHSLDMILYMTTVSTKKILSPKITLEEKQSLERSFVDTQFEQSVNNLSKKVASRYLRKNEEE